MQEITKEELKKIIYIAFKDVPKGNGLGARECAANDDYLYGEAAKEFRDKDIEQHWWEYPDDLKNSYFEYTLNYNNVDGKRFHIPALMTAVLDGFHGNTNEITLHAHLCEFNEYNPNYKRPHQYHHEYLLYLKSFDVKSVISYFGFTSAQVKAIALFLLWDMHVKRFYYFFEPRESFLSEVKRAHLSTPESSLKSGDYNLTLEEAIGIKDEEHRIVKDWFMIGGIKVEDYNFTEQE